MLRMLSIKNFSVFEDVKIEFTSGVNIITGETGAGKSQLVEGIKMVLGERFSKENIRDIGEKTIFEALFEGVRLPNYLSEKYDIEDELIIRREIDLSGKNRIYINGKVAILNELKEIGGYLIDIHGQHDHQKLLNSETHVDFVDKFIESKLLNDYNFLFKKYLELKNSLKEFDKRKAQIDEQKLKLREILDEIDELKIDVEEDSKLEDKIKFFSNIEKVKSAIDSSLQLLRYGEVNAENMLSEVSYNISTISDFKPEINDIYNRLESVLIELNDISDILQGIADFDMEEEVDINLLIDRKMKIDKLLKKYGPTLEDLINYRDKCADELLKLENEFLDEESLRKNFDNTLEELNFIDKKLHEKRKEVSKFLKEKLETIFKELELQGAVFEVRFKQMGEFTGKGKFIPEFYVSTNKGFEPMPLNRVVSGGELSRIMLAFKEVFGEKDDIETMIFDEVDTGISGKTAKKVAEKLKKIGQRKQLIVITHLPIVASIGNSHFHISKTEKDSKVSTTVNLLDENDRVEILATMISGKPTINALKQAEEMLKNVQ